MHYKTRLNLPSFGWLPLTISKVSPTHFPASSEFTEFAKDKLFGSQISMFPSKGKLNCLLQQGS